MSSKMNYFGKFINNFRQVYNEINAATLTGAIDVVVVEQPDGTFTCSPFHVRFGKIGVLRSREKIVDIEINGEPVDVHMKLGESGEAFFVEEVSPDELGDETIPPHLACSPIPHEASFRGRYLLEESPLAHDNHWDQPRFADEDLMKREGDLEIVTSSTPKVIVAGGSAPKIFKAETLGFEGGSFKLSGEFKPISKDSPERGSEDSADSAVAKNLSELDLNKDDDSSLSEKVSISLSTNKRKRRKKSFLKKKQNVIQRRNNAEQTVEQKKDADADGVFPFPMDDDSDLKSSTTEDSSAVSEKVDRHSEELAHIKDTPLETDIHFFSDTDLTPGCSPRDGRQYTPVQSDTEFETKRVLAEGEEKQSWRWGELPTSLVDQDSNDAQRSMLHNMLGFMKKTKHIRHGSGGGTGTAQDGIYLSDINPDDLDPEIAALYFPAKYKTTHRPLESKSSNDEDAESGNGPSLPHSPHSVEGAVCGPKSVDSDFDEAKKTYGEVSLSLCGGLTTSQSPSDPEFLHHIITFDEFASNPMLIDNPNLVVRVDGKMYNWRTVVPLIVSLAAFRRPLPEELMANLCAEYTPAGVTPGGGSERGGRRRGYSSWFSWGARSPAQPSVPGQEPTTPDPAAVPPPAIAEQAPTPPAPNAAPKTVAADGKRFQQDEEQMQGSSDSDSENDRKRSKTQGLNIPLNREGRPDKFRKALRLSSEQIASLNLREGANEIEFSVTTAYQGTSRCKCFLFKWRYDDKIVVSDIDGTITKSDVLGHILPIVGKDWAQSGVAKLFTKIKDNGYKLLYLSARAIGQSRLTRDYLKSIKQEDLSLPEGPLLLNPTSLLNALHREVIEKKPEEFKISCLRDIQALFPPTTQPFYAGYGNKINDVWAYQAVGIPIVRCFTINHRGELKHELTETFQSSYLSMTNIVDQVFPTTLHGGALGDYYSQFTYWREPIPELDLTLV